MIFSRNAKYNSTGDAVSFQLYGEKTATDEIWINGHTLTALPDNLTPAAQIADNWIVANPVEAQALVDAGKYDARFNQRIRGESRQADARAWYNDNPNGKLLFRLEPQELEDAISSMVDNLGLTGTPGSINQLKLLLSSLAVAMQPLAEAAGLFDRADDE